MERDGLPLPREARQTLHDLILLMHRSGLSPPEQALLEQMEASEASQPEARSSD